MDFNYTTKVLDFIEDNLPIYLEALGSKYPTITIDEPDQYVEDYFDIDKYKDNINVFLTPDAEYNYQSLSNESMNMFHALDVFITFKGNTEDILEKLSRIYLEAFFSLVKDNQTLGNNVDNSIIEQIRYYDGIEGLKTAKAVYIRIMIEKEV